ncbi:DUF3168 domain-containing protein [Rhizobium sp. P32RR-XVIII]|uniref:DUF3168 domain-containing protein n=1 Tax=Rhizobium sp. P32RR-XVIII TaxID=2726738 RepID=UPI0014563330|nr:DUF3168 domain-containing protein [Rhizobium sp. P32RR-XVIII]NLS04615.1 DUF3168 domain-containing protein [Rhizobium sp. P32RR-XVIII]
MEPSLALQAAVRARLVSSSALVALVAAVNIRDANGLPAAFPCILIGEGQTVPGGDIARKRHEAFLDLHIWTTESSLETSKRIAGAVRAALIDTNWAVTGLHVADLYVASSRFLRDPDGKHSHAVLSLSALVQEVA